MRVCVGMERCRARARPDRVMHTMEPSWCVAGSVLKARCVQGGHSKEEGTVPVGKSKRTSRGSPNEDTDQDGESDVNCVDDIKPERSSGRGHGEGSKLKKTGAKGPMRGDKVDQTERPRSRSTPRGPRPKDRG